MAYYTKYDPITALRVLKAAHRPYPSPYLSKGSLNGIGGPKLRPELLGKLIEG